MVNKHSDEKVTDGEQLGKLYSDMLNVGTFNRKYFSFEWR